jgi:hypothetical protein
MPLAAQHADAEVAVHDQRDLWVPVLYPRHPPKQVNDVSLQLINLTSPAYAFAGLE